MDSFAKRLRWAREQHGVYKGHGAPTAAAEAFGWKVSTYLGHENGDRTGARAATVKKYAKAYKVDWQWLLYGTGSPKSRADDETEIEGFAGAGVEFVPFEDNQPGLGRAPLKVEKNSGVLIVRGDSMYPRYFDGEYIYYRKDHFNPEQLLGQECVIKLKNGSVYIKILRKGAGKKFNLESWNAPLMEDQEVEWAAPVTWRRG